MYGMDLPEPQEPIQSAYRDPREGAICLAAGRPVLEGCAK